MMEMKVISSIVEFRQLEQFHNSMVILLLFFVNPYNQSLRLIFFPIKIIFPLLQWQLGGGLRSVRPRVKPYLLDQIRISKLTSLPPSHKTNSTKYQTLKTKPQQTLNPKSPFPPLRHTKDKLRRAINGEEEGLKARKAPTSINTS